MDKKTLLFDFDGVIFDSFGPVFEINKILTPGLTEEQMKERFVGNINESIVKEMGHDGAKENDGKFFDLYIPIMMGLNIFPGMADAIKKLSEKYRLIIVSSTITGPIREYMDKYDVSKYFEEIMGNDIHKSKVEKIKMVFDKYGVSAGDCLFITDTLGDLLEAEQTGVEGIGVAWGFHGAEILEKGKPVVLVNTPEELIIEIDKYFDK